jgi:2-methylcitrate dehydratase PrpD
VREIRKKYSVSSEDIRKITVYRHPDWAHYHVIYHPKTINEAQVSLPYSVAVAFETGDAFLDQYDDRYFGDPGIKRLMDAVTVEPDPKLPRGVSCLMVAETAKGETYRAQIDYPKGSKKNPMSDEELINKFTRLSQPVIGKSQIRRVVGQVLSLEKMEQVRQLTRSFQKGN